MHYIAGCRGYWRRYMVVAGRVAGRAYRELYANDAYEFRHGVTGLIVEAGVLMGIIIWQFS